ncbi:MAG: lipid-A-disaccharide synthase [Bacteroidales bacterium]|nr:lipid-A-disaccharide synthase [Bacteroidales bacterium]
MRYYIIAGEASGDLHGANLMRAICKTDPEAEIRFWGGDAMKQVGGTQMRHIKDLAFMGIIEVVSHLDTVLGNIKFCKHDIELFHPDAIIYIDYPGFNLKIAKWAHSKGYRNYHYISPQIWAWKQGRLKAMRRDLDKLFYILPFEKDYYADNKLPQAEYVGHPLLDAVEKFQSSSPLVDTDKKIIALLPGSRSHELKKTLPTMVQLAERHPEYQFVIAGMNLLGDAFYRPFIKDNIQVVYDKTYQLLSQSHAAVVCSGTATLETALFGVPQVVCYSANPLSIAMARLLIGNKIKFISLANLIADKGIVTELIQNEFNLGRLEAEFASICTDDALRQKIHEGYAEVRQILGNGGASLRVAQAIYQSRH